MKRWLTSTRTAILLAAALAAFPIQAQAQRDPRPVIPIQIDEIVFENGQLTAIGSIGDTTFEVPINLGLADVAGTGECPILALELGAIHLDLLGLVVDTSDICLDITAVPGDLLGDLLCAVAGLLDDGGLLGDILGDLTGGELATLLSGLTDLLNEILGLVTAPSSVVGVSGSSVAGQGNACDVLNLALGPIELNLLGLLVELDDCDGGPVTVDITAEPGEGRLLGNLLCSLSGLLDRGANDRAINRLIMRITRVIGRMI